MVLENIEILLDIKREQSKKKNKNIESSAQYNLRKLLSDEIIKIVSKFERNLIRLCRVAPKILCDATSAKANRNTLNRFVRKKR
jgi:hypothetical protein